MIDKNKTKDKDFFIHSSKMGDALKICVDTLIEISQNSVNDSVRLRARATVKEVYNIINKN
tara:strand:- start:975 stop:1157 length:183 start_codon:yes stop_codon:yes gene_type:complete